MQPRGNMQIITSAFGMHDTAPGGHQVDRLRLYRLHVPQAVSMHDFTLEQVSYRGKADVRVRTYVNAFARRKFGWTHVIEKDKRADHTSLYRREYAAHAETAEIPGSGLDDHFDRTLGFGADWLVCG